MSYNLHSGPKFWSYFGGEEGLKRSMNVTCPKCAANYDLAPKQMSTDGVKIRCASCGHIFKVVAEPVSDQGPWTIRHPTGATIKVNDISKKFSCGW